MIELVPLWDGRYTLFADEEEIDGIVSLDPDGMITTDYLDMPIEAALDYTVGNFPDNFRLSIYSSKDDTYLFKWKDFIKVNGVLKIIYSATMSGKDWDDERPLHAYFNKIAKNIISDKRLVLKNECYDDGGHCTLEIEFHDQSKDSVRELYEEGKKAILDAITYTSLEFNGFYWKAEFEKDESLFSRDVIHPLLVRLGFSSVRYNHGRKEYGKDFTFSSGDEFGHLQNYGLQVKAGDINGKVNSKIDQVIGQIEDAFAMPYYDIGSDVPKYISTFIVVTSGSFTENAKEKILKTIPDNRRASVIFFDRQSVLELSYKSLRLKK